MYTIRKIDGRTNEVILDRELMTSPQQFGEALEREYPAVTYEYPEEGLTRVRVWKHLALVAFKPKYIYELKRV